MTSSVEISDQASDVSHDFIDPINELYPAVNENLTPLPRSWNTNDKSIHINLTENNLRAIYKGPGKQPKDAGCVRANFSIPIACGIYYFEITIISKGKEGFMGIGLSHLSNVNMNRLPGWDKNSYGYHGDDGYSFCASNDGIPYGPTFSTGDVVGCCLNLIERKGFYTKNGIALGDAFHNASHNLFPTVGMQTTGEIMEANFGQTPFLFDFEDYLKGWKKKCYSTITNYPVGDFQGKIQQLVCSYLIHYGYLSTAETLAKCTGQNETADEDIASMKKRQCVQQLILNGRIEEAISTTNRLYPGLLDRQQLLLFKLQCRHFIEMLAAIGKSSPVNGHAKMDNVDINGKLLMDNDGDCNDMTSTEIEHILLYGRELQTVCNKLKKEFENQEKFVQAQQQLHEAFSLLAYSDPLTSPVGYLLKSEEREPISAALNSAILEEQGLPTRPPLELTLAHIVQSVKTLNDKEIGDYLIPFLANITIP